MFGASCETPSPERGRRWLAVRFCRIDMCGGSSSSSISCGHIAHEDSRIEGPGFGGLQAVDLGNGHIARMACSSSDDSDG